MADKGPLVSVILPVRDGESFVGDTLESALGQSYSNIEVIVVDDGSRDRTQAVVEAWIARDSRVRMIAQANRGVAHARNRAIAAARGEFIAPLDADDLWDPTKIERQVDRMIEAGDDTGLVYCWWASIDANGVVLDCSPRWQFEGNGADIMLQVNYVGNASVPLFRRRYLDQVGGYDATLRERDSEGSEDLDVALKVAERSRVAVVPLPLVAYRRRQDSMSSRTDRMWRSHMLVMKGARQRRPELLPASVRRTQDQLALHLASVSFWSGAHYQALCWGLRALRSSLVFRILPYLLRFFSRKLLRKGRPIPSIIRPGVLFSSWEMPQPLIPYDRIYWRRLKQLHSAVSPPR